jgi:hypothetical protein
MICQYCILTNTNNCKYCDNYNNNFQVETTAHYKESYKELCDRLYKNSYINNNKKDLL